MGKLTKEDKVLSVEQGQMVIHYDCNDAFLVGLVDALISSCTSRRISLSHAWANDDRSERLVLQLPTLGD